MLSTNINSNNQTLINIIPNLKTQQDINQIHARLLTTGLIKHHQLTTNIILKLASSPHTPLVDFARNLFFAPRKKRFRDPFLWNAVIKSYSHGREPNKAFWVLAKMVENGVWVDRYTVSLVLKAISRYGFCREGKMVHGFMKKIGFTEDLYLGNCLVCMYVKCGEVEFARQVFDEMCVKDTVSFNAMIDGYVKCGEVSLARELFDLVPVGVKNLRTWNCMIGGYGGVEGGFEMAWELFEVMPERDLVSWNLMVECCVKSGKIDLARGLFDKMPKRDVITWAKMVDGYAKLGRIEVARRLFDEIPERDVISCNVMMAGYVKNGVCLEALEVFRNMMSDGNLAPDNTTLSIALSAIAHLGHLNEGVSVHKYINENRLKLDGKLGVSLIDMYSKSGSIETAIHVFESISYKNVDHWNAMIGGLAIHGFGEKAFNIFLNMQRLNFKPDSITFVNVLNACAHSGMVKEGIMCFEIMSRIHKVEPKVQHFGCLVDMFARAGHIKEALTIIENMPIEPNNVMWRTLLSACNNLEDSVGTPDSMRMDYYDSSSYVLLSNIYARFGMWDRVRRVRGMMKERKLKKVGGRSWIELDGTLHEFFVGDGSHPQVAEIYSVLDNWSESKSLRLQSKLEPDLLPVGGQT